jgi:hypothetical protein
MTALNTTLMAVTNLLTTPINTPIIGGNGISPDAQGGSKFMPLPYPFNDVVIAGSATVTRPVHLDDMRYKSVPWLPLEPSREWASLVQRGIVSIAFSHSASVNTSPEDNLDAENVPN